MGVSGSQRRPTRGIACSRVIRHVDRAVIQLDAGQELLEHAMEVIADAESGPAELRLLARDLTEALRDTLRVAISRGHRLPAPGSAARGEKDAGPRLPAAAFG